MAANRDTKIIGYLPELVANPLARRGIRTVGELVDLPWETILHRTPGFGSLRAGLLLQFMEDEGLILIVHTGCDPGIWEIPALCESARPKYLEDVARRHKDLVIIAVHLGSYSALQEGMFLHEALELLSKFDNVYGDTSAVAPYYVKIAVEEVGSDRLLFGSDYPYVIGCTPCDAIKGIESLEISEKDKKSILYLNAEKLLRRLRPGLS
jgi:predicted TIM-barrel fold metal-dependent hydrolase